MNLFARRFLLTEKQREEFNREMEEFDKEMEKALEKAKREFMEKDQDLECFWGGL